MPVPAVLSSLSTEYVDVDVDSNIDMTGGTAEVAFTTGSTIEPGDLAWLAATIPEVVGVSDGGEFAYRSTVRILIGPLAPGHVLADGVHHEWVRLQASGSAERPVLYAGTVTIT